MEVSKTIRCPRCGQSFDLVIDTSAGVQRLETECKHCAHALEVVVECEPGVIVDLDVVAE